LFGFGKRLCIAVSEGVMGASKRATKIELWPEKPAAEAREGVRAVQPLPGNPRVPALRVAPLLGPSQPRRFVRVPTHAVGVHPEHREYPRATLNLPLRLRAAAGITEEFPVTLVTRDISSTGVYFLCPRHLAIGASLELEIVLVNKPLGLGSVVMVTRAHVCRTEAAAMPGWHGIAAAFDDVQFDRDDRLPSRFLKP
jgi:PilZ domain